MRTLPQAPNSKISRVGGSLGGDFRPYVRKSKYIPWVGILNDDFSENKKGEHYTLAYKKYDKCNENCGVKNNKIITKLHGG